MSLNKIAVNAPKTEQVKCLENKTKLLIKGSRNKNSRVIHTKAYKLHSSG
jgi:hypothetical protein